jgi:hypothetical protein
MYGGGGLYQPPDSGSTGCLENEYGGKCCNTDHIPGSSLPRCYVQAKECPTTCKSPTSSCCVDPSGGGDQKFGTCYKVTDCSHMPNGPFSNSALNYLQQSSPSPSPSPSPSVRPSPSPSVRPSPSPSVRPSPSPSGSLGVRPSPGKVAFPVWGWFLIISIVLVLLYLYSLTHSNKLAGNLSGVPTPSFLY